MQGEKDEVNPRLPGESASGSASKSIQAERLVFPKISEYFRPVDGRGGGNIQQNGRGAGDWKYESSGPSDTDFDENEQDYLAEFCNSESGDESGSEIEVDYDIPSSYYDDRPSKFGSSGQSSKGELVFVGQEGVEPHPSVGDPLRRSLLKTSEGIQGNPEDVVLDLSLLCDSEGRSFGESSQVNDKHSD